MALFFVFFASSSSSCGRSLFRRRRVGGGDGPLGPTGPWAVYWPKNHRSWAHRPSSWAVGRARQGPNRNARATTRLRGKRRN
ncbi:hypothetical protein NL676_036846 [Syzygium grande]|nr:hypothetical protein NL676_036846 [Syzygium grande]